MAHKIEPQIFCIGETRKNEDEMQRYLAAIGAEGWTTDALDDISEIIEVEGRGCYLAFGTELNENVTRVREGNESYLANIIESGHGSVLAHGYVNFQIIEVSRVFTHELVRHPTGSGFSQESLRYVRANDLGYYIPPCLQDIPGIDDLFKDHWQEAETRYKYILAMAFCKETNNYGLLNSLPKDRLDYLVEGFNKFRMTVKKKYTSAARRFLPIGMATKIGWSCNMRTLRNVLEQMTDPNAEEEIRFVFEKVGIMSQERWPNLFMDYKPEMADGFLWFKTDNMKV